MISNKVTKSLITFLIIIGILLIMPVSFANENDVINQSQDILTIAEMDDVQLEPSVTLSQKHDEIYVDELKGTDNGTGTSEDPIKSISEGLNHVNDGGTIYLNGRFTADENFNITFEGTPNEIKFIGNENTIIDGNHVNSFATVNNGTYSFSHISFINNYKTSDNETFGGVFLNIVGDLTFIDCLFENNTVFGVNKAHGGAIDNVGNMTIINCTFKNNVANVTNSSGFRKNSADGGALSNIGNIYVNETNFIENKALRNGGAIRTQDRATAIIDNCNFIANMAGYHESGGSYGGTIYTWDCGLEVYNSNFINNSIYDVSGYGGRGGALSLNRGTEVMNILYCQFINNTAGGKRTVDGQSICFDGVEVNMNYCTLDTSIYSSSQSVNLNYNLWIANDINSLIENLPSSSKVKTYAELKITSDAEKIEIGKEIDVFVKLCWNGTENQDNINLLPSKDVQLDCIGGILTQTNGTLTNGTFKTTFIPASEDILITATLDKITAQSDLTKKEEKIAYSVICLVIFEGEIAPITIDISNNPSGICLIDIDDVQYYAKIVDGNGYASIPNLRSGDHEAFITFLDTGLNEVFNCTLTVTVKEKLDSQMNVTVKGATNVHAELAKNATGNVSVKINGEEIANKEINDGIADISIEGLAPGTYSLETQYLGDRCYASKSVFNGISIDKKSTSISASSKTFKAKAKTKTVKVSLKTSDGKAIKGKLIKIKIKNKTYKAKTNKKGVAKFAIKLTKKGKYTASIKFSGDDLYKKSSKKIKIKIK